MNRTKFSTYFNAPGFKVRAVLIGIMVGSLTAIFAGGLFGAFVGAVTVLVTSLLMPVIAYVQELPYNKLKKTLPGSFVFDERVRFTVKNGFVTGYFVLTDKLMAFLSLEQGTHCLKLEKDQINRITLSEEKEFLNIYLDQTKYIQVASFLSEEMYRTLSEQGWNNH